jgi:hypothetical protein
VYYSQAIPGSWASKVTSCGIDNETSKVTRYGIYNET